MTNYEKEVIRLALINYKMELLKMLDINNNQYRENNVKQLIEAIDKILNKRYEK